MVRFDDEISCHGSRFWMIKSLYCWSLKVISCVVVYLITFCTCEVPFDSSCYLKMTVMQRFTSFGFSSSTFLNTAPPAELSLISCGQLCLSMHSGCFHSAHFWRVIYLLADLLISETHTHKSFTNTRHRPESGRHARQENRLMIKLV